MKSVHRHVGCLFALALLGACSVNQEGLGNGRDASGSAAGSRGGGAGSGASGGGSTAGSGGPGAAGTGGITGAGGTGKAGQGAAGAGGGIAGATGSGGNTGVAGSTGAAGTGALAGSGGGGAVGSGAAGSGAGSGGVTGSAGVMGGAGVTGSAGVTGGAGITGSAGAGGRGGAGGAVGCGACKACFRCMNNACAPDPNAAWTVICASATIAPLRPTGAVWDSNFTAPPETWPDSLCRLTLDANRTRATAVVTDTLMPVWNASVTPTSGGPITAQLLMSTQNLWQITITDVDPTGENEEVCTATPHASAADLDKGTLVLTDAGSCTKITLNLVCAAGGPGSGP